MFESIETRIFDSETDKNRRYVLKTWYDQDAPCPMETWDDYVDLYAIESGYDSTLRYDAQRDTPNFKTMEVFLEVWNRHNPEKALQVAQRFQNLLGEPDLLIDVQTTRGDAQGDWHTFVCAVESGGYGEPSGYIEEISQWAHGRVFGVTVDLETRCDSGEWHEIETVESCWGIYDDCAEDAADYFQNNFLPIDAKTN